MLTATSFSTGLFQCCCGFEMENIV